MSKDEINRLLAEKVMGWHVVNISTKPYDAAYTPNYDNWVDENSVTCCAPAFAWNPYDNIAQAMMVADKILSDGMFAFSALYDNGWDVRFEHISGAVFYENESPTLGDAICKAALKVVEND